MSDFVRLASKPDLPEEGEAREFPLGDKTICIANVDGNYCAMDNVCVHRGGPLAQGVVADGKIICPWHGWQYDPKTGVPAENPALKVAVYPIKIEGEEVLVEVG
ncbi:MAG TPA: Rieske (2Fe-2S) protein [Terriglobales bacterium]|nr:Rieske (2Fe-2S) protein [Terriglobales bacterium]